MQQLGPDGQRCAAEVAASKRTIEVRRALAAELRLRGDGRVFEPLTLNVVERWKATAGRAGIEAPQADESTICVTRMSAA